MFSTSNIQVHYVTRNLTESSEFTTLSKEYKTEMIMRIRLKLMTETRSSNLEKILTDTFPADFFIIKLIP